MRLRRDEYMNDAWCNADTSDIANDCFHYVAPDDDNCDYHAESDDHDARMTDGTNTD